MKGRFRAESRVMNMEKNYLLENARAIELYEKVKDLPIYDYHCHLDPEAIYKDEPCPDIGSLWLSGDHYKWRLMRQAGVAEKYITGDAPYKEKFIKYAESSCFAAGSPLFSWNVMELDKYFGIEDTLTGESASDIYERAAARIKESEMSPRKLIKGSNVRFIATTDDIADSLIWHEKLKKDESFDVTVTPSFRCDRLLLINKPDYADYIKKLEDVCSFEIKSIDDLCRAIEARLSYFIERGCIFTDLGIPDFPDRIGTKEEAQAAFSAALNSGEITRESYMSFLGYMMTYLGRLYKRTDRVMQLHLAVKRGANEALTSLCGADCGSDCIGDVIKGDHIIALFNEIAREGGMPRTIVYTLNPSMTELLVTIAGSFRNVSVGAAWWFCDHKRGIENVIRCIAEEANLGEFTGMLTDSRSFLSYARHDYFRRILCSLIGEWVENGEYPEALAFPLAKRICCKNIADIIAQRASAEGAR